MVTIRILSLILLLGALQCAPAARPEPLNVSYSIALRDSGLENGVRIGVSVRGASNGSTPFKLEKRWASVRRTRDAVRDVEASGADGRSLEVFELETNRWEVFHRPDEEITFRYRLRSTQAKIRDTSDSYFRVLITEDLFHMIGRVGMVRPDHISRNRLRRIDLTWRGFKRTNWRVASSLGGGESFRVRTTLDAVLSSVFVAGRIRIHRRLVEGNTIQFAIYGRDWKFEDREFVKLALQIVKPQRDFFDDHSQAYFLISLIPIGDPDSGAMGGTGLTNSFALFVSVRNGLEEGDGSAFRLKKLLAHELFHHWNGGKIHREKPEELGYWFSEGFTDFYSRRLLFRSGLISGSEYVESLNELFANYMLSPMRNEPNSKVATGYWLDPKIKEIPYWRGDIVALLVDHRIRKSTAGKRNLDDLMREVLRRSREDGLKVSTEILLGLIGKYTSSGFAREMEELIVSGGDFSLPSDLAAPVATLVPQAIGKFDLGFDFQSSSADGEIWGVVPRSNAYRAGLRDRQSLLGWSFRLGDVRSPVRLTVRDGSGVRKLSYLPQSIHKITVPQFEIRNGAR